MIGTSVAHYRVVSKLGEGGMGEVYRATDTKLNRDVALKVLPEQFAADDHRMNRFQREAEVLASLGHPNIGAIHGIEEQGGASILVLELVDGESLAQRVLRGPLSVEEALRLSTQIAKALEAAHKKGIVHRDLKPANIMVTGDGWVKVLDFGLAKTLDPSTSEAPSGEPADNSEVKTRLLELTREGARVGTAPYMSPEQARGAQVGRRADVWAFGCVLFEVLTARPTFARESGADTLAAILTSEPDWQQLPEELPESVVTLLGRCLQKDADRRLHSIADARIELEDALHPYLAPKGPSSDPAAPRNRPPGTTSAELGTSPSSLNYLDEYGPYAVVERLSEGGLGEIYRAYDRKESRDVALKVLRPGSLADEDARQRLRQEAEVLSRLDHPNVVRFHAFDTQDDVDYLVMEHVEGESLAHRLTAGPLPESQVISVSAQIADALAAGHERGIVHRDLKPGNVMLTTNGAVKVIDFGLAKYGREPSSSDERGGGQLTTPLPYLPPEALRGEETDWRGDVYALGVVAYQIATGVRPFREPTPEKMRQAILERKPDPPSTINPKVAPELDRIILRCLAKDPAQRYSSAEDAGADFRRLAASGEFVRPRPRRRSGLLAAGAVVAGLLVIAAVVITMNSGIMAPVVAPHATPSVVVIPGQVHAPEGDAFLAEAIPNTITTQLAQAGGLDVKLPPSSLDVARMNGDLAEIASAYGVSTVLVPTVTAQADRLVLSLQLVNAADRSVTWSQEYEGDRAGYILLARQAADDVRAALRPGSAALAPAREPHPDSSPIELALQKGSFYSNLYANRRQAGDLDRAIGAFEEVLEIDPANSRAAAGISLAHQARLDAGTSLLEVGPEIESWARRALDTDPRSAQAWAALSAIEEGRTPESYRRKLEYALKAAAFAPHESIGHTVLASPLVHNSHELALMAAEEASRRDPLDQTSWLYQSLALTVLGRADEALTLIDRTLALEPDQPFALLVKSLCLSRAGREAEAAAMVPRLNELAAQLRLHPQWVALANNIAIFGLAADQGKTDDGQGLEARNGLIAMARGEVPFPRWDTTTQGTVAVLARHGHAEEALELLVFRNEQLGLKESYDFLLFNEDLATMRDDPRFAAIVESAALRFNAMVAVLEEARARDELPDYLQRSLAELLSSVRAARGES